MTQAAQNPAPISRPPEGQARERQAKDRILDAGEREFADSGFAGASMRNIAARAGVAQGLLHYHFGAKGKLYEAVVHRRADAINAARDAALDALGDPSLPEIFDALFRPALASESGGRAYARILANMANGGPRDQALVARLYDRIAGRFIAAIRRAEPRLSQAAAARGYLLAIGVLVSAMGRTGRAERLMGDDADRPPAEEDIDATLAAITRFAAAGVAGLAGGREEQA